MTPPRGVEPAATHAAALRESLQEVAEIFSPSERGLLAEWLDRFSAAAAREEQP